MVESQGQASNRELIGFGEACLYKLPGPRALGRGNLANVMAKGVFLGFQMDTTEYILAIGSGTARPRPVRRLPMENRWVRDPIAALRSTPQNQFVAPEMKASFPDVETWTFPDVRSPKSCPKRI